MSHSKAKDRTIRSWTHSVQVLPSDHGDGHDSYGSGSRGYWASGSGDSQTVVGGDYDPERRPLLKSTAWHYAPDGSNLYYPDHSTPVATSIPAYNRHKLLCGGVVVILLLLVCGSFLESVYNKQKYNLLARRWEAEERNHVSQREIWLREAQEHQADREKWAQEKAAEQRKLDAISWKPLIPANKCLQYNTREYTSILSNVPLAFDAREVCAQKTVDLHGEQVAPTYCGGEGQCGVVAGHWIASKDEPSCQTVWAGPWDKGCQSPGTRHYHTYLENMLSWDNWHEMCMTTPGVDIRGVYHHSPNKCDSWNGRFWGVWFVHDPSCQ
ncbi:hypothetical protein BJ165DRAFT_1527740 [Panaeolus papilionaceus]|nr:hypothetical protein BJ165DRAFT_1527740 [Panaeolus papilionaceus]